MNALQCARYVYKTEGIRGFYRGLTASYAGISETMICFLIYETLKKNLAKRQFSSPNSEMEKGASDFLRLMMAAAFSKGCASCIAYPHGKHVHPFIVSCNATIWCQGVAAIKSLIHFFWYIFAEVIRTRLREEGSKYKYFFQTGRLIAVEEGYAAFYRGLIPQLIRQIPNTAIVLSTYELIIHLLGESKWRNARKLRISCQMDATENWRHTGQETFENEAHTFLNVVLQRLYGGTKAGCTVIQRAKRIILLKGCPLSK